MKRFLTFVISTFCLLCCFNLKDSNVKADLVGYSSTLSKFNKDTYLKNAKTFAVITVDDSCGKYVVIASNLNEEQFKAKEADMFQRMLQTNDENSNNEGKLILNSKDYKLYMFKPKSLGNHSDCSRIPINKYRLYKYPNGISYGSLAGGRIDNMIAGTFTTTNLNDAVKHIVRSDNDYKDME